MQIPSVMTNLGIPEKEAAAYLSLLRYGTQSISRIAQYAGLNRGTAYVVLHNLLNMGLVSKLIDGKIIHFSANPPSALRDLYANKLIVLNRSRERISDLLPKLIEARDPLRPIPQVHYMVGVEGAITAYEDVKTMKGKLLRLYLSPVDGLEVVGIDYMNEHTAWRISHGIKLRIIRPASSRGTFPGPRFKFSTETKPSELREVRYLPAGSAFSATQYIYDDTVTMITATKNGYSAVIQSQDFAKMQIALFDYIWSLSL